MEHIVAGSLWIGVESWTQLRSLARQQLVLFDSRGITLKDVFRVTVNTEGAHSPPLQRLMLVEGAGDKTRFRVVKDREIHTLSHIEVCGVRYSHAIVIEAALYLYRKLAQNKLIELPKGDLNIPVLASRRPMCSRLTKLGFVLTVGSRCHLGAGMQSISHIRAPR